MPAKWTAAIVGRLHSEGITRRNLATAAGVTPEYLSLILNGHRAPAGAEEKLNAALDRLIAAKNQGK